MAMHTRGGRRRLLRPFAWTVALTLALGALPASIAAAAQASAPRTGDDPTPHQSKSKSYGYEVVEEVDDFRSCPGCRTYVVNVPLEPTKETWGPLPNTTVSARVVLPTEWNSVQCGDEFGIVARDGSTADGQAVAGWKCRKKGDALRFSGPRISDPAYAAVRFLFRARPQAPTSPTAPLSAGFVDVLQTYLDGEQQLRRGAKQMLATRPSAQSALPATVWLPTNWTVPDCSVPYNSAGDPITGWTCDIDLLAGQKYRVRWTPQLKGANKARLFYFHAFTKDTTPPTAPVSLGNVAKLVDLMFEDGQIPTVRLSHVRPGFRMAPSTAAPTPRPSRVPRGDRDDLHDGHAKKYDDVEDCLPAGLFTIASPSLNRVDFPYGPPPGYPGFGWYGNYGDPCAPPRVVVDPCAGKYFSEFGHDRFAPNRRPVASACLPPEERAPSYEPAAAPPACPPRPHRSAEDRADRSHARSPLRATVEPTPPVKMVPPDAADTVARDPAGGEGRVLATDSVPSPEPTLRALLPDESVETANAPYCDDELPRTGGGSTPVLKLALGALTVGFALVLGAVYWRRHTYRERWYGAY